MLNNAFIFAKHQEDGTIFTKVTFDCDNEKEATEIQLAIRNIFETFQRNPQGKILIDKLADKAGGSA